MLCAKKGLALGKRVSGGVPRCMNRNNLEAQEAIELSLS